LFFLPRRRPDETSAGFVLSNAFRSNAAESFGMLAIGTRSIPSGQFE